MKNKRESMREKMVDNNENIIVRGHRAKMPICDFDAWHIDSSILEVVLTPFTKQDAEQMEDLIDDNFKIEDKSHEDK